MQAGFDDHTKAGRRAISPKWQTNQAKGGIQASSPSCDLINSLQGLVVLGRLPLTLDKNSAALLPTKTPCPYLSTTSKTAALAVAFLAPFLSLQQPICQPCITQPRCISDMAHRHAKQELKEPPGIQTSSSG